jgi:hypothetical protein
MDEIRQSVELNVRQEVGSLLMLRSSVTRLFQKVALLRAPSIILDFSQVEFMSRSFADEYLTGRALSEKTIEERNLPPEVSRMLQVVAHSIAATHSDPFVPPAAHRSFELAPVKLL